MKNRFIKYIIFSLLLGVGSMSILSCSKWLDVSPKADMKAEDIFKDETGFRDALIGIYALMVGGDSYGKALSYEYVDILANYYDSPRKSLSTGEHRYNKTANFNYTASSEEARINGIWNTSYKAITNINMALEYIDKKKAIFSSEDLWKMYKGELLALRAFLHFDMLRLFGPAPKQDDGNGINALSIPYVSIYTNNPQPQLTVKDFIKRVADDLLEAKKLLKESDPYGPKSGDNYVDSKQKEEFQGRYGRMNYWATTLLLARVYTYSGDNELALAQAKEMIGEPDSKPKSFLTLATSAATEKAPYFETEKIFYLNVNNLKDFVNNFFIESFESSSSFLTISDKGKASIFPSSGLDKDFRQNWLTAWSDGKSFVYKKFKDQKYIPLFRMSELYLIAAETSSGTNKLAYLNQIRRHRGLSPITKSADFEIELYKEYRREFMGEGQLFYFYKRKQFTLIGASDEVSIGDLKKVYNLPIPTSEKDNGNIKIN